MPVQWFRMLDADPSKSGCLLIRPEEAARWNAQGFGIFWTVNAFRGPRRLENLESLLAWAVDIDEGDKGAQLKRLKSGPLIPSRVVDTRRGFHVYWRAKDAKPEHWNAIVLDRLVPYYGADKNARDIARILRAPGFDHLKDPAHPYRVEAVWEFDVAYTERQVVERYEDRGEKRREVDGRDQVRREVAPVMRAPSSVGSFWDAVYNLDCEEGLRRLSGHSAVRGEEFTFYPTSRGNLNIRVDGKGSSAWIDANRRIGSLSHGGPTLYQWLRWYDNSPRDSVDVLKRLFPALKEYP